MAQAGFPEHPPSVDAIEVVGARTHNLKNVSFQVPRGRLTVVTGVSGSGKSSLAFDTLYAEGQRRYVESMSTYARQFIEKMQRPDVDAIHNIPPAIALEQKNSVANARSTIGTATEVNDFLRLLFARVGHVFCPDCDEEVAGDSPATAAAKLAKLGPGKRLVVLAPVQIHGMDPEADGTEGGARFESALAEMRRQGFTRAMAEDGTMVDLEDFGAESLIPAKPGELGGGTGVGDQGSGVGDQGSGVGDQGSGVGDQGSGVRGRGSGTGGRRGRSKGATLDLASARIGHAARIDLVADRVASGPRSQSRLAEALEVAFRAGAGRARVRDADSGAEWVFTADLACPRCGRPFRRPEPAMFSFSSPLGACPTCQGFGRVIGIDLDKVIPDWSLTLRDEPVAPWNTPSNREMYDYLRKTAPEAPWDVPLSEFTPEQRRVLIEGNRGRGPCNGAEGGDWCGIQGFFGWLEKKRYKIQARVMLARYRAYTPCPDCGGARLRPEALAVRMDGQTIAEVCSRSIEDLHEYFDLLRLSPKEGEAADRLLQEIRSRLHYLDNVGLGYLTLDRQTRTLSGGEAQRINLATALGSSLTETLYVLDEPTVGLHSRDTFRLLAILQELRETGNTVVVVEHDPDIILGADEVIDVGPAAGELGGEILYAGPLQGLARAESSITARYLARPPERPLPSRLRRPEGWITVRGARENNLKDLDVRFPRGAFCCVTGVSGSGKTSLVQSVLYAGFRKETFRRRKTGSEKGAIEVGKYDRIEGIAAINEMLLVDQRPIGRSSRSNPVTYVKAYDGIRALFASTRQARRAGVKPGHFSFNVDGGRCGTCAGAGVVTLDMHFLADVEVVCEECDGKRFVSRILDVTWNGRNIDDVLDMTVCEAMDFFAFENKIVRGLQPLANVGLGYIRLGQSTATLSGGEAQRLKLAGFLATHRAASGVRGRGAGRGGKGGEDPFAGTFMIFDEPTTGLHAADLERLVRLLHDLVDRGASVLVIEHNLDLIGEADWIIDLGPEGGDAGGRIVAEGPPQRIMACAESHTGRFLRERFGGA
jgi:excinuclease ABC subunit A